MAEEQDLETFLKISPTAYGIYLFDTINRKNLYLKELNINTDVHSIDFNNLDLFVSENIFKIEKLAGNFVNNINIVIENKSILTSNISIKEKKL